MRFLQEKTMRVYGYVTASAAVLWGLFWFLEARGAAPVGVFLSASEAASPLGLFLYTTAFAALNLVFAGALVAIAARHESAGRPLGGWGVSLRIVAAIVMLAFVYALVLRGLAIFGVLSEDYAPMAAWHLGLALLGVTLVGAGMAVLRAPLHRSANVFPFLAAGGLLGYLVLPHARVSSVVALESIHYVAALGMLGVAFMLQPRVWRRPAPARRVRAPRRFAAFLAGSAGQRAASAITAIGALLWAWIWYLDGAGGGSYRVFLSASAAPSAWGLFLWTGLFALAFMTFAVGLLALGSRDRVAGKDGSPIMRFFASALLVWFVVALLYRGLAILGRVEEDYGPWHFTLLGLSLLVAALVVSGCAPRRRLVQRAAQLAAAVILSIYLVRSYHVIWFAGAEAGALVYAFAGLMFAVGVLLWPWHVTAEVPRGEAAAGAGGAPEPAGVTARIQ